MRPETEDALGLYGVLIPWVREELEKHVNEETVPERLISHAAAFYHAEQFDARQLPRDFVYDTGEAAFHEMSSTDEPVRLPYPVCYFEFADGVAVVAHETSTYDDEYRSFCGPPTSPSDAGYRGTYVQVRMYSWGPALDCGLFDEDFVRNSMFREMHGDFWNGMPEDGLAFLEAEQPDIVAMTQNEKVFYSVTDGYIDKFGEQVAGERQVVREQYQTAAYLLLGSLSLLRDKLVTDIHQRDPHKWTNDRRKKKGKPPLSGPSHILSVDVPAVRYAVNRGVRPLAAHESPRLHWRRGHWRVLHRGSEFEGQTWVRKHLVGDPDKGFIRKTYRLVHNLPMMADKAFG